MGCDGLFESDGGDMVCHITVAILILLGLRVFWPCVAWSLLNELSADAALLQGWIAEMAEQGAANSAA